MAVIKHWDQKQPGEERVWLFGFFDCLFVYFVLLLGGGVIAVCFFILFAYTSSSKGVRAGTQEEQEVRS